MSADLDQQRHAYRNALASHDWRYQHSDDYSAYLRGEAQREKLHAMAARLDPQYEIWNEVARPECRRIVRTGVAS